jgi:Brp/Blh family beta-carotene 15,15'-monooxygenase
MSIYHFSGDWDRDLDALPRLIVAAAMIAAPAALHRAQVVEIFSWLSPIEAATTTAVVMAAAAAPLLQASAVVIALLVVKRPLAAAELAVVLALAWLTPPLMFFLAYFCGLHSVRHMIETQEVLRIETFGAFVAATLPYAPLAVIGTIVGALVLSSLPPGPALISTIFMALGALTVPHIILIEYAKASTPGLAPDTDPS